MIDTYMATEHRRFKTAEIAHLVQELRESLGWKQIALAEAAYVDERTIQRVEAAEIVSDITLRKIATAFRLDINHFTEPHDIKTPEQLQHEIDEYQKEYTTVSVERVSTGKALMDQTDGADASYFEVLDDVPEEARGAAATLFDYIRDLNDIWSEMSFSDQYRCFEELTGYIRELESIGCGVCVGKRRVRLRASSIAGQDHDAKPIPFMFSYIVIVNKNQPLKALIVPRRGPIEFR